MLVISSRLPIYPKATSPVPSLIQVYGNGRISPPCSALWRQIDRNGFAYDDLEG